MIHLSVQHNAREAARRAGPSATVDARVTHVATDRQQQQVVFVCERQQWSVGARLTCRRLPVVKHD